MRKLLLSLTAFLLFTGTLLAQKPISGKVTDENGNAVPNASVIIKGTSNGTTTKLDGTYSLSAPSSAAELLITSVGFESVTVPIGNNTVINVNIKSTTGELGSVVITGYTRVKKSEFAGAATKVGGDKINYVPNASFDQILQGKAPGLLVTVGSGQPGASAKVQIRGASSINGGNAPLYVLDGMPIEDGVFQSLNPNDFESVDVLRDAVSTAQYGNRGSNGVIVITTKKGRAGKMTLSYNGQAGITQPGAEQFEMMNTAELLRFQEIIGSKGIGTGLPGWVYSPNNPTYATLPAATKARYDFIRDSLNSINTDWRDVFQRQGTFQSHDVNLSGGNGPTRYFLSAGHYTEDGIGLRSNLKRYTIRGNLESRTDKVTVSFNTSAGYTRRNFIESEGGIFLANPFAAAYLGLPYQKLFNQFGTPDTGAGKTGPNAYARVYGTSSFNDQIKLLGNVNVSYNLTKSIYIGGFAGIDFRTTIAERSVYPGSYAANSAGFPTGPVTQGGYGQGSFNNGLTSFLEYIARGFVGYRKVFAQRHDVDIQVISEYTRDKTKSFAYTGYGISPKLLNTPVGITPGTGGATGNNLIPAVGGARSGRSLYAAMALARYTFNGKYTLNASFRRDASSQLPEANRWTNFYAAGLTWNIKAESFADNWSRINDLRLRLSYGIAANADGFPFGDFGYLAQYGKGLYEGLSTIVATNAGNPNLSWEKIGTLNLGVDFGLLRNRLTGSVDVYNKRGFDQIVTQTLPAESGFFSQDVNAATTQNRGVEVLLNGEIIRSRNVTWSVGGNVAYNKNKVVDLGQVKEFEQGTEIVRVGLPIGSHYIVKWGGVDAATGAPLYYTKNGVLTNVYSDNDKVADFGTYNAPWIGGFNTAVSVKGVSLNALFTFQQGFQRFNNQDFFQLNHAFALQGFNMRREMLSIWQKPGDVTDIQSPLFQRQFVSKDVQDASFLRFRTLTLAYDFAGNILDKTRIFSGIRIYVQAQNLATWTKWTGFDPEDDNNLASYEYPTPRTYTVGLNVSFK